MPRPLRNYPAGSCLHLIQRGDNRRACFHDDEDKLHYLELLSEYSLKAGCDIHAYVLTTNHVHLLLTVHERNAQSQLMKAISQFTARWMRPKWNDRNNVGGPISRVIDR